VANKAFRQTLEGNVNFPQGGQMGFTIESLVELLNKDLELEYSAAIQYINHSAVMSGAEFGDLIKELKIHTNEEIQHAMILADQIDYFGGSPSVSVGPIRVSKNNKEMMQQDLDGEEDAIKRYKLRIDQAEQLKEFALSQQLRTILAMEQEHAMDLIQALGK
jgi:bacterioferritin